MFRIQRLGEDALLLRLGERIDPALNARVHALAAMIDSVRPPWLVDIVPAHASLALCIDIDMIHHADPHAPRAPLEHAEDWLRAQACDAEAGLGAGPAEPAPIPVRYGAGYGPDLGALAAGAGLEVDAAIALHAAGDYRV